MLARDVMTSPVRTIGPDTPVPEIARLLLDEHISAVPVVDAEQRVLGIVSEGDLFRRRETGTEHRHAWWLLQFLDQDKVATEFAKAHGRLASDVMTPEVVAVEEDTPVSEIADLLERHHIKRVPVLRSGKLVGLVSRANLLRALAFQPMTKPGAASDRELRDAILASLAKQSWFSRRRLDVVVQDGVARVWGLAMSEAEHKAILAAVHEQAGVKQVVDGVTLFPRLAF